MTNGEKFKDVFGFGADGSKVIAVNSTWWDCEYHKRSSEELSKPHWISVEERLPEHLTSVIVHRKDGGIFIWEFFNTSTTDECWMDDSMNVYSFYDVTHWMPLPEPPKGEDDVSGQT